MGGGNCLYSVEDKTIPLLRGNKSVVEVASTDTNPTKLPDTGAWQTGTMDTSVRYFDLLCLGKCASENNLKLNIQSTGKIPNLLTKNANGDIVFREPTPMCTIQSPKGHNVWVNIELKTITTTASDYMCLGIRKRGEDEYYDVLHGGNLSRYVDILETDVVELIPLASSTKLPTYTAVKAGDSAKLIDADEYDFGSVYRVNVTLHDGQWLKDQPCDLWKIYSVGWNCDGRLGVGSIVGSDGQLYENQFVVVNCVSGQVVRSSDGIHWLSSGSLGGNIKNFNCPPVYGNGVWCVISWYSECKVRRSINYGGVWTSTAGIGSRNLAFANGVFMTITDAGIVYTSPDAEIWTQIGTVSIGDSEGGRVLAYGNDKWIYASQKGRVFSSKDGREWEHLGDGLYAVARDCWWGGCYADGYFYASCSDNCIRRSFDGVEWNEVVSLPSQKFCNVTCCKNKLYVFYENGTHFHVGLFRPDGTIDEKI